MPTEPGAILDQLTDTSTADPNRPDYRSPQYHEQRPRWKRVDDVREGTDALRLNKALYLPKFEAEDVRDWESRVQMTYANDDYAQALTDIVGLVFAEAPKLEDDVPTPIADLLEDVDGEGSHWITFLRRALEVGLHLGHAAIWTDYPALDPAFRPTDKEKIDTQIRPYWQLVKADEIISWRSERIGGVEVLTQFVRCERITTNQGQFGAQSVEQYRVVTQAVERNAGGIPVGLGQITWALYKKPDGAAPGGDIPKIAEGNIIGPKRIPLRAFYCGEKFGMLHSKPFLYALATTSLEETQVRSDYAAVMHRCNVPAPYFKGLPAGETINMSQGIRLPTDGDAGYLEPKGTALATTRLRLADIGLALQRQGGNAPASDFGNSRTMTATQAAQIARQRNARVAAVAQGLQDAAEGSLADMAAFMTQLKTTDGGSIFINQEFAGAPVDPAFITVCLTAFQAGAITRDEMRYALQHGELPEDTDPETTAQILDAVEAAKADAEAKAQAAQRAMFAKAGAPGAPPGADPAADPKQEAA